MPLDPTVLVRSQRPQTPRTSNRSNVRINGSDAASFALNHAPFENPCHIISAIKRSRRLTVRQGTRPLDTLLRTMSLALRPGCYVHCGCTETDLSPRVQAWCTDTADLPAVVSRRAAPSIRVQSTADPS